jgi:hypothetical protein
MLSWKEQQQQQGQVLQVALPPFCKQSTSLLTQRNSAQEQACTVQVAQTLCCGHIMLWHSCFQPEPGCCVSITLCIEPVNFAGSMRRSMRSWKEQQQQQVLQVALPPSCKPFRAQETTSSLTAP